jgi:hypothetical protein
MAPFPSGLLRTARIRCSRQMRNVARRGTRGARSVCVRRIGIRVGSCPRGEPDAGSCALPLRRAIRSPHSGQLLLNFPSPASPPHRPGNKPLGGPRKRWRDADAYCEGTVGERGRFGAPPRSPRLKSVPETRLAPVRQPTTSAGTASAAVGRPGRERDRANEPGSGPHARRPQSSSLGTEATETVRGIGVPAALHPQGDPGPRRDARRRPKRRGGYGMGGLPPDRAAARRIPSPASR